MKEYQMSYVVEKIAGILKAAREQKGMSQRDLSALAGVPQSHISRIEKKEVDLRISSLAAIAHALGLELMLVPIKAEPAVKSIASLTPKQIEDVIGPEKFSENPFVSKNSIQQLMDLQKILGHTPYNTQTSLSQTPKWRLGDEDSND